ncbi:hypothetical protein IMZ48_32250 [Candidatus Bathyarchaeota archaeon]|nr:hypothetical protein [Candidatus Bathyarchaeota archaeon]
MAEAKEAKERLVSRHPLPSAVDIRRIPSPGFEPLTQGNSVAGSPVDGSMRPWPRPACLVLPLTFDDSKRRQMHDALALQRAPTP